MADTLADDEMGTEQATATGDDGFWVSGGEAKHDYRVAPAQAIHDALVGGPLADFNAAMTVASANQSAALNGAITQFHVVVDPAVASQTTDDAEATCTDDKAFDDAQLDDTQLDDTAQTDEATDAYSDLESGDYDTEERADNQAAHDLATSDANGQTAASVSFNVSTSQARARGPTRPPPPRKPKQRSPTYSPTTSSPPTTPPPTLKRFKKSRRPTSPRRKTSPTLNLPTMAT